MELGLEGGFLVGTPVQVPAAIIGPGGIRRRRHVESPARRLRRPSRSCHDAC